MGDLHFIVLVLENLSYNSDFVNWFNLKRLSGEAIYATLLKLQKSGRIFTFVSKGEDGDFLGEINSG